MSLENENFARQIKESVTDKERFIKLFEDPLDIRVDGEVISVQNEDEMSEQYDYNGMRFYVDIHLKK